MFSPPLDEWRLLQLVHFLTDSRQNNGTILCILLTTPPWHANTKNWRIKCLTAGIGFQPYWRRSTLEHEILVGIARRRRGPSYIYSGHVVSFWSQVKGTVKQLTDVHLGGDPARYLLHHSDLSRKPYKNSLLIHLVNAA